MPKQERVPRALHAELTEHAALLRALKTRHLLGSYTRELAQEGKQRRFRPRTQDVWTTWPLPDFPAPEFTLRDEVTVVAEHTAREVRRRGMPGDDDSGYEMKREGDDSGDNKDEFEDAGNLADENDELERLEGADDDKGDCEGDEEVQEVEAGNHTVFVEETAVDHSSEDSDNDDLEPVSSPALAGIATEGAHIVLRLLAELATHRARAAGSSLNRMWPFDWEDVLHVAAARGVVEPSVIEAAHARLRAIYGPPQAGQAVSYPSDLRPAHKSRTIASAKAASRQVLTPAFETSFLDAPHVGAVRRERQDPATYYPSSEFIMESDLSDE